jgi:hypothetical protein
VTGPLQQQGFGSSTTVLDKYGMMSLGSFGIRSTSSSNYFPNTEQYTNPLFNAIQRKPCHHQTYGSSSDSLPFNPSDVEIVNEWHTAQDLDDWLRQDNSTYDSSGTGRGGSGDEDDNSGPGKPQSRASFSKGKPPAKTKKSETALKKTPLFTNEFEMMKAPPCEHASLQEAVADEEDSIKVFMNSFQVRRRGVFVMDTPGLSVPKNATEFRRSLFLMCTLLSYLFYR